MGALQSTVADAGRFMEVVHAAFRSGSAFLITVVMEAPGGSRGLVNEFMTFGLQRPHASPLANHISAAQPLL
jgi:hypothetical protein